MFQIALGNTELVATGITRSTENASMAVVTFTNGSVAGVSISPAKLANYWNLLADGNYSPKFLSPDGRLLPTFIVRSIDGGQPVILQASSNKPLKY